MKKLVFSFLLLGSISLSQASTFGELSSVPDGIMQSKISPELFSKILEEAVLLFYSEYAITTSVAELQAGYEDGTVTVGEIAGEHAWSVSLGGGILVVISEDSF